MVLLAHVRSAFALWSGTYGGPRMTRELRDDRLTVGRRRTACPMIRNKSAASRARGMSMGGQVPLGYDVRDQKLAIKEEGYARVRRVFALFVATTFGTEAA